MRHLRKDKALWLAAALGLGTALTAYFYLAALERELRGGPLYEVVVVRADLALGQELTASDLQLRELPERYLEDRHVRAEDLEQILGARATTVLTGGSSLLWTDLDTAPAGRTLSSSLAPGMRAVALIGREHRFDGLLRAGDRVDVLLSRPDGDDDATLTLLQNVLVLSVGSNLRDSEPGLFSGAGSSSDQVTLSVSVEQAQLLAHAEDQGRLRLSLRNPRDAVISEGLAPTKGLANRLRARSAR